MTSQEIIKADVLDILFENRNKKYGAYLLRKGYNYRLLMALSFSVFLPFVLLLWLRPKAVQSPLIDEFDPVVKVTEIDASHLVPPPMPGAPPPPQRAVSHAAQEQFSNVHIVNKPIETALPTQTDLLGVQISDHTEGGVPYDGTAPAAALPQAPPPAAQEPAPQPAAPSYSAPEFPGGPQAWTNFLNRYLVPPADVQPGEKKTVLVKFLVSKEGVVTGFEVVQSAGADLDNEVIRVLKKMPKWRPAVQNGNAVSTSFTQPVTFVGIEE